MADYYPLVAKAIAGLDPRAPGESRRKLYERARAALIAQLRGVQPPLSETEIVRERLALEEAVRKVESEAAARAQARSRAQAQPPSSTAAAAAPPRLPTAQRWPKSLRGADDLRLQREEKLRLQHEEEQRLQLLEETLRLQHEEKQQFDRDREDYLQRDREYRQQREEEKLRPAVIRHKLAEMASPAPSLSPDGRLDAGRNVIYDAPLADNDLPTLPIRQGTLIKTIVSGLPRNAPRQLIACLENYSDELKARGVQPILGLLKDMAAIIDADVGATDASREWLEEGLREAFRLFADNHALFVAHFPLDPEREELYARTSIDETGATGRALSEPFEEVAEATLRANHAVLTTDDFLNIVDKLTEFAKVTSTLPPRDPRSDPSPLKTTPQDRIDFSEISPKKRVLLSGFGFFERAYNLLGSTASIVATPEGMALLVALEQALASLSKLIGFG
jgi:hypothetical protein